MFFGAILTLLVGTALSASILHKEIDIGHNGVHYKVTVDAEKYHTDNSLGDAEGDSTETDVGKIGLHYEVPHDDLHHHDEEGKHHGVVLHIELGKEGEEHGEHHDVEHHGSNQHEEHHEFPEYENTKQQQWGISHHGSKQHSWQNDDLEHSLEGYHGLIHKPVIHGIGKHHIGYTQKHLGQLEQGDQQWGHLGQLGQGGQQWGHLGQIGQGGQQWGHLGQGGQQWGHLGQIGQSSQQWGHLGQYGQGGQQWGHLGQDHYGTQNGVHQLGQDQVKLWHLLHSTPIHIQGGISHHVPVGQQIHYGYEQEQPIVEPFLTSEVIHTLQHPELHH